MLVDRHPGRLRLAEKIGAIPIDDTVEPPIDQVKEQTTGQGADKGCECVGWQAHDPQGREQSNLTMNALVDSVRATGRIGVVGVFVPQDPTAPDPLTREGRARPSFVVSHELALDDAPEAYRHFDARDDGWTKVVLKP